MCSRLGRGWEFGARFRLVSGPLQTPTLSHPALPALYAADAGSYAPLQGTPYSERLPLFHQLDIRLARLLRPGGSRLLLAVDAYNVLNSSAVLSYDNTYIPGGAWLQPLSILTPRFIRLSAELEF